MAIDMAWVNGTVTPAREAVVPVLDRGFLFGDACYEVIRVYQGVPWHFHEHLERLQRSAEGLRMERFPSLVALADIGRALFAQSGHAEGRLYYQVTRGVGKARSAPITAALEPTIVVIAESITPPSDDVYTRGVSAVTVPESRWERSDLKTTNLMPRILVRMDAQARGAYEALWVDAQGHIREGTMTNFFAVIDGILVTQALEPGVVDGITRREVLHLARIASLNVAESAVTITDLSRASEAFITGTTPEVLGIVCVDNQTIGTGNVGPITQKLHSAYQKRIADWVHAHR